MLLPKALDAVVSGSGDNRKSRIKTGAELEDATAR
jgi:hypothetical protein